MADSPRSSSRASTNSTELVRVGADVYELSSSESAGWHDATVAAARLRAEIRAECARRLVLVPGLERIEVRTRDGKVVERVRRRPEAAAG